MLDAEMVDDMRLFQAFEFFTAASQVAFLDPNSQPFLIHFCMTNCTAFSVALNPFQAFCFLPRRNYSNPPSKAPLFTILTTPQLLK